jgi:uncharacterized protein
MRRKDRQVTNLNDIEKIITTCKTVHIAMIDNDLPYIVPLSFGYKFEGQTLSLYFHSAEKAVKLIY